MRREVRDRRERLEYAGRTTGGDLPVLRVGITRRVLVEEHDVLRYPDRIEAAFLGPRCEGREVLRRRPGIRERGEESDLHDCCNALRIEYASSRAESG